MEIWKGGEVKGRTFQIKGKRIPTGQDPVGLGEFGKSCQNVQVTPDIEGL